MTCIATVDYCITAGQSFNEPDILYADDAGNPIDLTGATSEMALRSAVGRPLVQSFNGVMGGAAGTIKYSMTPLETDTLLGSRNSQSYAYDVKLTESSGDVSYLIGGTMTFNRPITDDTP